MNKMIKRWLLTLLTLVFVVSCSLFFVSCGKKAELTLKQTKLTMITYDDYELSYELKNSDEAVVWSSSDDTVVAVVNGKLTAKQEGVATITASVGKISATCEVTVLKTDFTPSLYVGEDTEMILMVNGTYTFSPKVNYKGEETEATFAYESNNEAVATVTESGTVTANAHGEAIITIKANFKGFEIMKTVRVTVKSIVSGEVTVNGEVLTGEFSMYTTDVITVNVKTLADGTADDTVAVEWSKADDGNLATIAQNGKDLQITANKSGSFTLKVSFAKGGGKGENEYTVTILKKVFNQSEALFIDKGGAVGGMATVLLPSAILAADVKKVSVAGVATEVSSVNASQNSVTFAVANLQSGEISLGFETELFCYAFDNTVVADMVIKNKADFTAFGQQMINKTTSDKYYVLGADIDYENGQWSAGWPNAAGQGATFAGIFDGRGFAIRNVNTRYGIFTTTIVGSVIKNTVFDLPIVGSAMGAGVVKTNNGTIENCVLKTKITKGEVNVQFAGLVHTNGATGAIKNCVVEIASYVAYDTVKKINAIAYTNKGAVSNCYAITEHSDYTYGEVTDGLYATKTAFFADVTSLAGEDGWNTYWSLNNGKLYFNGKQVL